MNIYRFSRIMGCRLKLTPSGNSITKKTWLDMVRDQDTSININIVLMVQLHSLQSSHIARVWINRVRSPILLVVSSTGKMKLSLSPFAPENLVSLDVSLLISIIRLNLVLSYGIPPEFRGGGVYLFV